MKRLKVLHVEDNPDESWLLEQAFEEARTAVELNVVRDGEEAVQYLRRNGTSSRPDLVLLDLNLPKKNGFEVLETIKNDPDLKVIPVFVFTGSEYQQDIRKAYQLHANAYIKKPDHFSGYAALMGKIVDFCRHSMILP